jgi:hypothetical protein
MKRLLAFNIIAFLILAVLYFYSSDLDSGINKEAFTWGLPLLIAAIFTLIGGIFTVTRKNWRWGVSSLAAAVAAFIYMGMVLHFCCYAFLAEPVNAPQESPLTEEDKILALIISDKPYKTEDDCSYNVVRPEAFLPYRGPPEPEELEKYKDYIKEEFNEQGYDFDNLVDKLFELNKEPVRFTLKSSPKEGYYIDYDGKFDGYGWFRFHLLRPHAAGFVYVSVPAYDAETGYVLAFYSYYSAGDAGMIGFIVDKYEDGKLIYITAAVMGIS